MSHLRCLGSCSQKQVESLRVALCGPPATVHGRPLWAGVQSGTTPASTPAVQNHNYGDGCCEKKRARQRASAMLLAWGLRGPLGPQCAANKEPNMHEVFPCEMGPGTTSKQRTPPPLAAPRDEVGAKGGKPGGRDCTRPPFGRTARPHGEQTKVPGPPGASSRPCLGKRSIPGGRGVDAPRKRPLPRPQQSPWLPSPPQRTCLAPAPAPAPWQRQAEAWLPTARPSRLPGQA